MSFQQSGTTITDLDVRHFLAKKAAGEAPSAPSESLVIRDKTVPESIVTAGDKVLSPVAKFFNTSKSNVAGVAAGTASALGYYILSGLWDKKGTHKITRGLAGLGLGLGVGFGTKYGLDKLRPRVQKLLASAAEIDATPEEYAKFMKERAKVSAEADKHASEQDKKLEAEAKQAEAQRQHYFNVAKNSQIRAEGFARKNPTAVDPKVLAARAKLREEFRRLEHVTSAKYVDRLRMAALSPDPAARAEAEKALAQYRADMETKHARIDEFRAANELNPYEQHQELLKDAPLIFGKSNAERKKEADEFLKALGTGEVKKSTNV